MSFLAKTRNPGGLPDQVRHDTVEVFFVPYTESMSFLALPGNPGGLPKNSRMPDQVRHDTVEVFFVPYTESMSFLAKTWTARESRGTAVKNSWMPDQVRHDTVEVFFVPYTESMSFLACPGIRGDCQRTPGCLIKSGMTQLKYSLFRTQNQCHSWLAQESGGLPKNSRMPDQVRHDTVEVFFVPYTESMSFLAKTRNPGGLPDQVRHDTVEVFFVPYTESMSFLGPGIRGDCQRRMPDQVRHGVFFVPYTESKNCPTGCLIKSGMTQLKYSLFRTQNQCHSWLDQESRGTA